MARYQLVKDEESLGGTLGRGALRSVARAGEAVAGLPGDIIGGVAGLGNLATHALTGQGSELLEGIQQKAPGSQFIRENVTEPLTGEYLKPQGDTESFLDELVGDLATLLVPGGIASKGASLTAKGIAKTGAKALAGVGAKHITESATGSELAGNLAKFATLSLANTIGGRNALDKKRLTDYSAAEKQLGNKEIRNLRLQKKIGNELEAINKSVSPDQKDMKTIIQGIEKNFFTKEEKLPKDLKYVPVEGADTSMIPKAPKPLVKEGYIKVKDIWNLKKQVNEWLEDPNIGKGLRAQLQKTNGILNGELLEYGKKNSEFLQPFLQAEEIHKAMRDGSMLNKFLQKNVTLSKALDKWAPLSAVGYTLYHANIAKPTTLALGLGAGMGVREAVKMGEFLYRSPIARKHYASLLRAAQAGNGALAAKEIRKIDEIAAKEEGSTSSGRYQLIS